MKKGISLLLAVLLLTMGAFTVSAATPPELSEYIPGETPIENFMYTSSTSTSISITSSGVVTGNASIIGYQGITTSVDIFLYIQQYKNGAWTTIGSWYKYTAAYYGGLQGQMSVPKGYSYRIKASYYANCGSSWENIISYSPTRSY